jgi:TolB-like protein/Tfp pilus assembly protein PilF
MIGQDLLHYRVLSKLGQGGMGEVFLALDTKLERQVALKLLPEEMAANPRRWERFVREARAVAALNHPNIVTIYAVEEAAGRHFFAMELVEGDTLERLIPRHGFDLERFFAVAAPLVDALTAAHRQGILHRDFKPDNVMIGRDGRLKVLDFGVAKAIGREQTQAASGGAGRRALTEEGSVLGTARYMSPEQACGEPVDARTDIFSLGIVLFEMATGRYPFAGSSAAQVLSSILRDQPPLAHLIRRELPQRLGAIINRCLQKPVDLRYPSAGEVAQDLAALRREVETTPPQGALARTVAEPRATPRAAERSRGTRSSTAGAPALAVLPLTDLAGGPDYFAAGLTEELITALARMGSMRVISRQSVMRYRGSDKPLPDIAGELGVDHVLEGSVLRAGDRVRISLQLVRAQPEEHLWAERYERDVGDVLNVQNEVARAVAQEISGKLTGSEDATLLPAPPMAPEVLDAYLKGRYFLGKRTKESLEKAKASFRDVLALNPAHAGAHAGLADALALLAHHGSSPETAERARAAARRALELDPRLADAHASLGFVRFFFDWDWAGAEQELLRALELSPNHAGAHHWYWSLLAATGRREEAARQIRVANQLDPLSPIILANVGVDYYFAGDPVRAINQLEKALELEPEFHPAHFSLWRVHEQLREYDTAVRSLVRGLRALGRGDVADTVERLFPAVGYGAAAEAAAEQLIASGPAPVPLEAVAWLYLANGCREQALAVVEDAFAAHLPLVIWLAVAPEWAPLREEPRMRELLALVKLSPRPAAGAAQRAPQS